MSASRYFPIVFLAMVLALQASGANYYVAPQPTMRMSSTSDAGDGTFAHPWDLKWTLEHRGSSFKAGDSIWLTNGVYHWSFQWGGSQAFNFTDPLNASTPVGAVAPFTTHITPAGLNGAPGNPIVIRALPGCHAQIDGWFNISSASCNYVRFQDLDVGMTSYTNRATGGSASDGYWYWATCKLDGQSTADDNLDQCGFNAASPYPRGVEIVNCSVRDCGNCGISGGFGMVYGCIFQHNGFYNNDGFTTGIGARGHGFYYQGKSGMDYAFLRNCISTGNAKLGGQANGTGGGGANYMNMLWDGLICYNNGTIASGDMYHSYEFDFASESDGNTLANDGVVNCVAWTRQSGGSYFCMIDFSGEPVSGYFLCTNNFIAMEATPQSSLIGNNLPHNSLVDCSGNTCIGQVAADGASVFPNNTYLSSYPTTGTKVFIQTNAYEPLRGQLAIYNYGRGGSVNLSLSALGYAAGTPYTLHNAADYWGDMVTGVYTGSSITIDMQAAHHSVAAPVGVNFQKEPTSFPDFGAFIIESGYTTNNLGGSGDGGTPAPSGGLTGSVPGPLFVNPLRTANLTYLQNVVADYHMDSTWADSMNLCPPLTTNGATLDFSTWCGWMTTPSGESMYPQNFGDAATALIPHGLLLSNGVYGVAVEAMVYVDSLGLTNGSYPLIALAQGSNALQVLDGAATTFAGVPVTPAMLSPDSWHYLKLMLDTNGYSLKLDANTVISVPSMDFYKWNPNADATLTLGNFNGLLDEVDIKSYNDGGPNILNQSPSGTNAPPTLAYRFNPPNLELNWTGSCTLLGATNILGPWTPIPATANAYTNSLTNAPMQLFRLLSN